MDRRASGRRALGSLRRHATTLILVTLAVAAAFMVFVVDRGAVSTREAEDRKRNLFEAWRPDDITELTLTIQPQRAGSGAARTARIVRGAPNDAGQRRWQVEIDGQEHAADEQAVDQYLGTLEFASAERRVSAEAADAAALGLDAPRLTVTVRMGARRDRLTIGGSAPTPPGAVYAEVAGRGTFVITQQLAAALDVPPERFRSRSFVPYVSTELSGIELDGAGGRRRFVRAPWGGRRGAGFRFAEGPGVRASAIALDGVLAALGRMQAEAFLSEEQAQKALATQVTLTLVPSDPRAQRGVIDLGGACPDKPDHVVALRREPTRAAACVPSSVVEPLDQDVSRFVDLALIGAPLDEVAEVKLTAGDRALELARSGTEWHLRAPEDRPVPTETGRALVQALLDVYAERLLPGGGDLAPLGLVPPRATLRVISTPSGAPDDGPMERVETLEIGAEQAGVVRVRRLEDGAIAELSAAAAGALLPSDVSLRPVQLFDFDPARVRSLRIDHAGRVQRLERGDDDAWRLVEPAGQGLIADAGLADDIAEQLGTLKAARWVARDAKGGFGLDAPRVVIEAEVAAEAGPGAAPSSAPPRKVRLALGAPTPTGAFAQTGDSPAVFVASRAVEAAAGRLLVDRSLLAVPIEQVARITLKPRGRQPVVVVRSAGGFAITGALSDAASAARAAGVRDALADLRAEGAVALGAPEPRQGLSPPELQVVVELGSGAGGAARRPSASDGERDDAGLAAGARAPAGAPIRIDIGAGDAFQGTSVRYVRREGVAAIYAVAQARVRPLLEAAGVQ